MKKKVTRILPLVLIAGLLVAISASTQIWTNSSSGEEAGSSLPLLVLVNRLELTTEQMEEMRDILLGIQVNQDAQQERIAAFEEEMIAFDGSAEELDERLEIFRAESQEQAELARAEVAEAMDRLTEILSFKQGEILQSILPGLLGTRQTSELQEMMSRGRMGSSDDESLASSMREHMQTRIEEQLEDRPEVLERLRERFGGLFDDEEIEAESGLGFRGRVEIQVNGQRFGREFGGLGTRGSMGGMMSQKLRAHVLDQLIDVLTLKLEAQQ